MALNLPTTGESARLKPMRIPGVPKPKTFTIGGPKKATVPGVNSNDQFRLNEPYNPKTINQTAQTQYDSDAALAQKNAQMGFPTTAAIGTDYAARGGQSNQIYQDLAAHLAGIQTASVAQGNAGSAVLGQQNAAAAATAPNIAGAPVTGSPIPTPAVQAVLGSQTAAGGNYYGTLGAASLSAGAQANQKALDAGGVAQADNTNSIQRTLASLLSGLPSESAREGTMTDANQKVDAANIQTKFSVYQNLVSQQQYAQAAGDKRAQAVADNALKQWETSQSNATKVKLGIASDQTKLATTTSSNRTKTQIAAGRNATSAANNRRSTATSAANSKRAANAKLQTANAKVATSSPTTTTGPTTASGKPAKGYTVGVRVPKSKAGPKDLLGNPTTTTTLTRVPKKFTAAQWQAFVKSGPQGKRKLSLLGLPEGSKVDVTSAVAY